VKRTFQWDYISPHIFHRRENKPLNLTPARVGVKAMEITLAKENNARLAGR
jgi:hypothetical protein